MSEVLSMEEEKAKNSMRDFFNYAANSPDNCRKLIDRLSKTERGYSPEVATIYMIGIIAGMLSM